MASFVPCNQSHLVGKYEFVFVYNKQMSPLHYHFFLRKSPKPSSKNKLTRSNKCFLNRLE